MIDNKKVIYIDGVFDLFHRGHLESLIKAKNVLNDPNNTYLIVGVVSDEGCASYKRNPIINESDRVEIIKNIVGVDKVIFPCPLVVSLDFVKSNDIDLVVHGFSNDTDREKQKEFFAEIKDNGCFQEIEYYSKTSTTDLINKIKLNY
jgi:choline-phosphate cytidylyltransferase